jgi:hypothetical protein
MTGYAAASKPGKILTPENSFKNNLTFTLEYLNNAAHKSVRKYLTFGVYITATAQPRNSAGNSFAENQAPSAAAGLHAIAARLPSIIAGGHAMTARVPSAIPWLPSTAEGVHAVIEGVHSAAAWLHSTVAWPHSIIARGQSIVARRLATIIRRQSALIYALFAKNRHFSLAPSLFHRISLLRIGWGEDVRRTDEVRPGGEASESFQFQLPIPNS